MKAIIEAVPEFECRCNLQRYGKIIEVLDGDGVGSVYESLSADDRRAHGLSPYFGFTTNLRRRRTPTCSTICEPDGQAPRKPGHDYLTQAANDLHPLSQMIDDAALGDRPGRLSAIGGRADRR